MSELCKDGRGLEEAVVKMLRELSPRIRASGGGEMGAGRILGGLGGDVSRSRLVSSILNFALTEGGKRSR